MYTPTLRQRTYSVGRNWLRVDQSTAPAFAPLQVRRHARGIRTAERHGAGRSRINDAVSTLFVCVHMRGVGGRTSSSRDNQHVIHQEPRRGPERRASESRKEPRRRCMASVRKSSVCDLLLEGAAVANIHFILIV